jgi:hypothetical protein
MRRRIPAGRKSSSIDSTVSVLMRRRIRVCDMRRRIPEGRAALLS